MVCVLSVVGMRKISVLLIEFVDGGVLVYRCNCVILVFVIMVLC